jgi:hypothetical protein
MWPFIEDFADRACGPIHEIRRIACFDGIGGNVMGRARQDRGTCAKNDDRETDSRIR